MQRFLLLVIASVAACRGATSLTELPSDATDAMSTEVSDSTFDQSDRSDSLETTGPVDAWTEDDRWEDADTGREPDDLPMPDPPPEMASTDPADEADAHLIADDRIQEGITDACTPSCAERTCGRDGCGGSCGFCTNRNTCIDGQCLVASICPDGYIKVGAGTFLMGSPADEPGRYENESRVEVTIDHAFCLKETEVTQGEWKALMGNDPAYYGSYCGDSCPVEQVSWYDAAAYCNELSEREGFDKCYDLNDCMELEFQLGCQGVSSIGVGCNGYRLPMESEWEYAARAGTTGATYGGTESSNLTSCTVVSTVLSPIAWYCANSDAPYLDDVGGGNGPQPVGQLASNAWGFFDMLGNVEEWCDDQYKKLPSDPNETPDLFNSRTSKGGSLFLTARSIRAAARRPVTPAVSDSYRGFRPARSLPLTQTADGLR